MYKDLFRIKYHLPRVPSLSCNYSLEKSSSSSINKALRYTSNIAFVSLCSLLLVGCLPPDQLSALGGGGSSGGSSSGGTAPVGGQITQCTIGPADLAGACRNTSALTPGALEAIGPEIASAAALNIVAAAQEVSIGSVPNTLNIAWSPFPGSASGYFVYYGPTSDTANTLASDLPIDGANLNASAPTISYQPTVDLGLSTGDTVCFRILAYDTGRVPYTWYETQCTVVS